MEKKNVQKLILKGILCFLALPLILSIFTSKASLQNTNSANTVRRVNANKAATSTPVRKTTNKPVNTTRMPSVNTRYAGNTYMPEPTPTPLANSTVRGRVFYAETGRPVKRTSIMLMKDDGMGGPDSSSSALTDGDGNFQIKKVRAGTYYAMINAPGVVSPLAYADFSKQGEREGLKNAFEGFEKIVVDGITDLDVQIPARRGGAIGGRVMYDDGDPAIGVKVEILRKVDGKYMGVVPNLSAIMSIMSGSGMFQTDDRGVYRFAGLPPGDYILKVTESTSHGENFDRNSYNPFESALSGNSFLTVFYPDAFETKSAQLISIQLGQEISEINLVIPSRNLYKMEGRIVNLKDKSSVKARIIIKKDGTNDTFSIFNEMGNRQPITSISDENGNWKFKDLPKGTYKITVEPLDNVRDYNEYDGDTYSNSNVMANTGRNIPPKPKLAKKTEEIVIDDKDLTELVIEVGYGATLSGTVAVENSAEMPNNVTIQTTGEKDDNSVYGSVGNYAAMRDERAVKINHDFKLEGIPEGKNYFSVSISDNDYYVKSATLNGADLLGKPFEVKEGDVLRNIQIVLSKDVGTLKGVVLNDDKEPVKGLEISIALTDPEKRKSASYYRNATTNQNGEFEIKAAPGEYAIIFPDKTMLTGKSREEVIKWFDEAVKAAQTVRIEAGKTETLTVKKKN